MDGVLFPQNILVVPLIVIPNGRIHETSKSPLSPLRAARVEIVTRSLVPRWQERYIRLIIYS